MDSWARHSPRYAFAVSNVAATLVVSLALAGCGDAVVSEIATPTQSQGSDIRGGSNDNRHVPKHGHVGGGGLIDVWVDAGEPVVGPADSGSTDAGTPDGGTSLDGGVVLVGAGDIAICGNPGAEATAKLLDQVSGAVFAAGDTSNEEGSAAQFANCFAPTWGRHLNRIRPAVGNHEYLTPDASPYYDYFKAAAGPAGKGYYSYELGAWHIVVLNSNCSKVGGCGPGSPQETWLAADLAAHPTRCTLAYWHHPRFSSGAQGSYTSMLPIWRVLYAAGVEVVLNGHDHVYERFARQDPDGNADPARGIREFIVGTGGAAYNSFPGAFLPNSEVQGTGVFGVLKLTLYDNSYEWTFVPEAGKAFADSGREDCH